METGRQSSSADLSRRSPTKTVSKSSKDQRRGSASTGSSGRRTGPPLRGGLPLAGSAAAAPRRRRPGLSDRFRAGGGGRRTPTRVRPAKSAAPLPPALAAGLPLARMSRGAACGAARRLRILARRLAPITAGHGRRRPRGASVGTRPPRSDRHVPGPSSACCGTARRSHSGGAGAGERPQHHDHIALPGRQADTASRDGSEADRGAGAGVQAEGVPPRHGLLRRRPLAMTGRAAAVPTPDPLPRRVGYGRTPGVARRGTQSARNQPGRRTGRA